MFLRTACVLVLARQEFQFALSLLCAPSCLALRSLQQASTRANLTSRTHVAVCPDFPVHFSFLAPIAPRGHGELWTTPARWRHGGLLLSRFRVTLRVSVPPKKQPLAWRAGPTRPRVLREKRGRKGEKP